MNVEMMSMDVAWVHHRRVAAGLARLLNGTTVNLLKYVLRGVR